MRRTNGIVAVALCVVSMPLAAQSVRDGVEAWQRGDYPNAVRVWRPLADGGDGDAAFDLAQAYKLGRGVPLDMAQAKSLYGRAAKAGHVQGTANYGLLLFQDGDRKAAMPWIAKASEAGDPRAQYVYGTALFNGDLAAKDWPRAYAFMTRAASAGLPQATTSLAEMDRFMPAAQRQKGLELASTMATSPVPPLGRQLVTVAEPRTTTPPPAAPPTLAAAAPVPHAAKPMIRAASPATRPTPQLAGSGAWQVQLGAYGSQAGAAAAWGKLSGKLGGLRPRYEQAGAVVRLRAAGLPDRDAATRACAAAKAAGSACFPVAP